MGFNTVWADKITEVSRDHSTFEMSVNVKRHGAHIPEYLNVQQKLTLGNSFIQ